MPDTIISVTTLPETLSRRFRSKRVRVTEDNENVILAPVFTDEIKKEKPYIRFIGTLSQESYDEITEALLDTQKVDYDEW